MTIDPTRPGRDDPAIELERLLDAPVETVWRHLVVPELLARWWVAGDIQPIVGYRFTLDMGQWGEQPCEVLEVQTERLFRFLFSAGNLDTNITWSLAPEGTKTRLTLRHEGFNLATPAGRYALQGMGSGWPAVLHRLAELVGDGSRMDAKLAAEHERGNAASG